MHRINKCFEVSLTQNFSLDKTLVLKTNNFFYYFLKIKELK